MQSKRVIRIYSELYDTYALTLKKKSTLISVLNFSQLSLKEITISFNFYLLKMSTFVQKGAMASLIIGELLNCRFPLYAQSDSVRLQLPDSHHHSCEEYNAHTPKQSSLIGVSGR